MIYSSYACNHIVETVVNPKYVHMLVQKHDWLILTLPDVLQKPT